MASVSSQTSAKNLESKNASTQTEFKPIFETDDVLAVLQMAGLPLAATIPIFRKVLRSNPGLASKLVNATNTGLDLAKNLPSASLEGLRGFFPKKAEVFDKEVQVNMAVDDKEVQVNMDMDEEIVREGGCDIPEDRVEENGSPPIKTPVLITSKL